jgi:hypothetical protein
MLLRLLLSRFLSLKTMKPNIENEMYACPRPIPRKCIHHRQNPCKAAMISDNFRLRLGFGEFALFQNQPISIQQSRIAQLLSFPSSPTL